MTYITVFSILFLICSAIIVVKLEFTAYSNSIIAVIRVIIMIIDLLVIFILPVVYITNNEDKNSSVSVTEYINIDGGTETEYTETKDTHAEGMFIESDTDDIHLVYKYNVVYDTNDKLDIIANDDSSLFRVTISNSPMLDNSDDIAKYLYPIMDDDGRGYVYIDFDNLQVIRTTSGQPILNIYDSTYRYESGLVERDSFYVGYQLIIPERFKLPEGVILPGVNADKIE